MVTAEQVRELIGEYSPEGLAGLVKSACAPATFVEVEKIVRLKDVSDLDVRILGVVRDLPGEGAWEAPLLVADVELKKDLTERSSRVRQFKLAKAALQYVETTPPVMVKGMISQGVFVFHDKQGNFRVSLVTVSVENGKFKWSQVKRQSFYVQADPDANATFIQRMCMSWASLKDIKEVFSVEKLTKEFYNQLYKWYERACDDKRVEYPNDIKTDKDNRDDRNRKHLLRLITRLMFVWFLKQKKLVPEELFDEAKLKTILKDFNPVGKKQHQYYRAILQNLFFATLNSEIEEREFADAPCARKKGEKPTTKHHGVKTKYRYADEFAISKKAVIDLFHPIPFLNGGLFECLDQENDEGRVMYYDGFSQQEFHRDHKTLTWAHVPNDLFFDSEYGIIPLLKRYNFTVEENTPGDADVALDPELLGKVFENLLGAYNPETEEVVRKSTGSFYTPREIVNYMVDESLIAYLDGKTAAGDVRKQNSIRALVKDGERPDDEVLCSKLSAAVVSAKVLDPACGSGAFPMGALLKMTELLRILNRMPEAANLYKLKLQLIENCIFGSDIQEIAVQISKLRFFISLVCEQKPNWDKPNYGINTLPNLETKFVAANSLIGLKRVDTKVASSMERVQGDMFQPTAYQADLFFDNSNVQTLKDELWAVRHKHFLAQTRKEKNDLRRQDKELRTKLADLCNEFGFPAESGKRLASWDPYDQNRSSDFLESEWMFNVKDGFDIVIGNPPYISAPMQLADPILKAQRERIVESKQFNTLVQKWDLYIAFIEKSLCTFLAKGGAFTMIVPFPLVNQTYGAKLRKLIVDSFKPVELADLNGTKVFESATVSNCIPLIVKDRPSDGVWISHFDGEGAIRRSYRVSLANFVSDQKTCCWNLSDVAGKENRHAEFPKMGDYCYISKGMVLHAKEDIARGAFTKDELISEHKDKVHCKKYLEGKDVDRFEIRRTRYLEFGTERCPGQVSRPTFAELYSPSKILVNQLGSFSGALDTEGHVCNHTVRVCVLWNDLKSVDNKSITSSVKKFSTRSREDMQAMSRDVDLRFLLGVLNSTYGVSLVEQVRHGDVCIYPEHIRNVPIPPATKEQQKPIVQLVDQILASKQKCCDADTSALEAQIDALVYKLYGLTEEEIAVVEAASGGGEKKVKGKGEGEGVKAEKAVEVKPVKTVAKAKRAKKPQFAEEF